MICPISCHAERMALITDLRTWSYREMDLTIRKMCTSLKNQLGGSTAAFPFICETKAESLLLIFSLLRLKIPAYPINFRLPANNIAHTIKELGCPLHPMMPLEAVESLIPSEDCEWDMNALATLLSTSGSTGIPKLACHSLGNHYYSALGSNSIIQLFPEDRWLLSLPLYHVGGLQILFRCFLSGATALISEKPLLETILHRRITHLSLVPTQLFRLLKEDKRALKKAAQQVKAILLGGGPISVKLFEQARDLGFPVYPTYGCTEMTSQICTDLSRGIPLSCGYPLPYREIALAKDGEILVKGQTLFQGYWKTGCKLDNGWFATGDLGQLDQEGRLKLLGRKDNLFISGGENIQPEEIERHLLEIPGVIQAIVVPLPDAEFGAKPVAFIDQEDNELHPDTIQRLLRKQLPSYKIPIQVHRLDVRTGLKPDRSRLRAVAQSLQQSNQLVRQGNFCFRLFRNGDMDN